MSSQSPKIILSGGGTGGHIYPAIAIANAIKAKYPNAEFLFVGAKGKMEMEKVPEAGYKIEDLWISGLQRKLTLKNLSFPLKVISSLLKAKSILRNFKPDVVIGTGGFASGPMLKQASSNKIPTLIQEQNSYAGITNKLLAKTVKKVCVAYEGMEKFFPKDKIVLTGNPVRNEVVEIEGKREQAFEFFGLNPNKKTILVVGGSLGSLAINNAIKSKLQNIIDADVQLIWQTGKTTFAEMDVAAKPFTEKGVKAHQFINKMDLAYAAADMVISRAGAIAVSELCLVGKPIILVPLPHAAEDHQRKNAEALVNHNAAVIVTDKEANQTLVEKALEILSNENQSKKLAENILRLAIKDSAEIIANEALKLIKK